MQVPQLIYMVVRFYRRLIDSSFLFSILVLYYVTYYHHYWVFIGYIMCVHDTIHERRCTQATHSRYSLLRSTNLGFCTIKGLFSVFSPAVSFSGSNQNLITV